MKTRLQQFITRLLVRFKQVKRAPVDIEEINLLVNEPLPEVFELATPGGEGELSILGVTISIEACSENPEKECLHAEILCNFSVKVKQSIIYNTHLMLMLETQPNYCVESKTIGIIEPKITELQLISDKYSLIKDTSSLMGGLIPKSLKPILDVTLFSTKAILNTKTVSNVTKYLSIYTAGSKQKVIDYHRADIENRIIQLTQNNAMSYQMNDTVFEEKLFADFGVEIVIDDGKLFFVFSS